MPGSRVEPSSRGAEESYRNSFKVERKEGRGKNAREQKRTNRNNGVSQASAIGYASGSGSQKVLRLLVNKNFGGV